MHVSCKWVAESQVTLRECGRYTVHSEAQRKHGHRRAGQAH